MLKAFVFALAFLLVQSAMAQDSDSNSAKMPWSQGYSETSSVHIIPAIGLSEMSFQSSSTGGSDLNSGISGGALLDVGSGRFVFETGLMYNQFGGKQTVDTIFGSATAKINLNYLSIPLLAKFNFSGDAERTFFAKLGLLPSVMTDKSANLSVAGVSASSSDIGVKSFDMPLVFGLGGAIPVAPKMSLMIEADYIYGFMNINDSDSPDSVRNQGFLVITGLSIGL